MMGIQKFERDYFYLLNSPPSLKVTASVLFFTILISNMVMVLGSAPSNLFVAVGLILEIGGVIILALPDLKSRTYPLLSDHWENIRQNLTSPLKTPDMYHTPMEEDFSQGLPIEQSYQYLTYALSDTEYQGEWRKAEKVDFEMRQSNQDRESQFLIGYDEQGNAVAEFWKEGLDLTLENEIGMLKRRTRLSGLLIIGFGFFQMLIGTLLTL